MKKIGLLLGLLIISFYGRGQSSNLQSLQEVKFFGIDYSNVKVYGATETERMFAINFERINLLFLSEPGKYDMGRLLKKRISEISVNEVNNRINSVDFSDLKVTDKNIEFSDEDVQRAVDLLEIESQQGVGVVVIAGFLDKVAAMGYYKVVFFDMENSKVIANWNARGKAGGFGLRNFWAASVYNMIKKNKIRY